MRRQEGGEEEEKEEEEEGVVRKVIEGRNKKADQDSPSLWAILLRASEPSSITLSSLVAFNTLTMAAGAPALTHAAFPSSEQAQML